MIQAFEKASGRRVPYKIVSRRTGDVAACYADTLKAGKILNWRAVRTLEDMCDITSQPQDSQKFSVL
jgi:UDP-glucose 4-epimerase